MTIKERRRLIKQDKKKNIILILLQICILSLFMFIPLYLWLTSGMMNIGITSIRGDSMQPTFSNGQILYVQPAKCERGEIIVVNCQNTGDYNVNGISLLKRIVGMPGELIEIVEEGVLIDNQLLDESNYIANQNQTLQESNDVQEVLLSDYEYFVIGDNRKDSFDSRHIGPVHSKDFLYGLTTEPNEYTFKIIKNVVFIVFINTCMIIGMNLLLLHLFTKKVTYKDEK